MPLPFLVVIVITPSFFRVFKNCFGVRPALSILLTIFFWEAEAFSGKPFVRFFGSENVLWSVDKASKIDVVLIFFGIDGSDGMASSFFIPTCCRYFVSIDDGLYSVAISAFAFIGLTAIFSRRSIPDGVIVENTSALVNSALASKPLVFISSFPNVGNLPSVSSPYLPSYLPRLASDKVYLPLPK